MYHVFYQILHNLTPYCLCFLHCNSSASMLRQQLEKLYLPKVPTIHSPSDVTSVALHMITRSAIPASSHNIFSMAIISNSSTIFCSQYNSLVEQFSLWNTPVRPAFIPFHLLFTLFSFLSSSRISSLLFISPQSLPGYALTDISSFNLVILSIVTHNRCYSPPHLFELVHTIYFVCG